MGERSLEHRDEGLHELLQRWEAPGVPARLDERVAESFRRECARSPLWRRLLQAKIPVPAPLAPAVVVALMVLGWRALQEPAPRVVPPAAPSAEVGATAQVDLTEFEPLPDGAITVVRFEGGAR